MPAAIPRIPSQQHLRLNADATAIRIVTQLRTLRERRDHIDDDELTLIEQARALGWTWDDLAAAYGPSPRTAQDWTREGARRRWVILNARETA